MNDMCAWRSIPCSRSRGSDGMPDGDNTPLNIIENSNVTGKLPKTNELKRKLFTVLIVQSGDIPLLARSVMLLTQM